MCPCFFLVVFFFFLQAECEGHAVRAEGRDCIISRLIVKQIIDPNPIKQFSVVCDVTACHIAQTVGVPINHVNLIAYDQPFFGKTKNNFPATIHVQVPGVSVGLLPRFSGFSLFQRVRPVGSWMYDKWGPLPSEESGITLKIISDMSLHDDLPQIVALDTFVGNRDRGNPNLFYDEVSDRFYGIDLGDSFRFNLAKEACMQFERLSKAGHKFLPKEMHALKLFLQTMKQLVHHFDEQSILAVFSEYSFRAGFFDGSVLYTSEVKKRIKIHNEIIRESIQDSKKLITKLSHFLGIT